MSKMREDTEYLVELIALILITQGRLKLIRSELVFSVAENKQLISSMGIEGYSPELA